MNQYCRYCTQAVDINDDFYYCEAKKDAYNIKKSKRVNHCKDFEFCQYDLWRVDKNGEFVAYKPRQKDNEPPMVNMSLWEATK